MNLLPAASLLGLALLLGGCSGGAGGPLYVPMPDADLTSVATNPDGVAYPASNIGGRARSASQPGQTFPDLTLEGVRSAATADTPAVVSMAEYYDPEGLRNDLLHVMAIFMWCPHCNNETNSLAQIAGWQTSHRVAAVQIAMQNYDGGAPGWSDVQQWARSHNLAIPVLVDAQGSELGQYFPVNAVPVNIAVDPRTMEVLSVDIGEVGDVESYEQGFLPPS